MKEITFTKQLNERVFTDHRPDKFWCVMSTTVKAGKLTRIDIIWNYTPVTLSMNLVKENEWMSWAVGRFGDLYTAYGQQAVDEAEIVSGAESFENLNEEVARLVANQTYSTLETPPENG
jgi:hypothetical protein